MHVEIVQANVTDAAEILALQKLAYQSEAILYDDWSIPPLTQTLTEIEAEFSHKTFLKAHYSEMIVGSVRASIDGGTCSIGRLIMHPEYQRKGIGTKLMSAIEARFPLAHRFELFTGEKSKGNIRLYNGLGYREFRTERMSEKVVIVFMEKLRQ
ncbi:MAG: GNAT family N-acetyltransferase [Thermodesulfobacteriota bacterium]